MQPELHLCVQPEASTMCARGCHRMCRQVCYGRAMSAQHEWELSIGAGAAGQFTVPIVG